ncbi:16S rRNA (guanine(527)-N(7))-methyltransferase RsmG [Chloroflexota bacterium]
MPGKDRQPVHAATSRSVNLISIITPVRGKDDIIMFAMEKLILGATKLGLSLNPGQLEQFNIYYQELVTWNQRMNLTTITGYDEVQTKHFLDSLTVTLAMKQSVGNNSLRIIDVGTGAGIPGLPLKILFPNVRLVLLDATAKKATFLEHLKQKLGLDNVEIVVGRAEEIAHQSEYRERFGIVLSRAVAPLATLVELTLPFCTIGGSFIAQKKGRIEAEIDQATKAISTLGGSLREVKMIGLEEFADERYLVIIDKVSPAPAQYPRHPGIPSKKPLT